MNDRQLDMVLGYLNEGESIDEMQWLIESFNNEIDRFEFANEDIMIYENTNFLTKIKEKIKDLILKIKNFIIKIFNKFVEFLKSMIRKIKGLGFKAKVKAALAKKSSTNESYVQEATGEELLQWMKESRVSWTYHKLAKFDGEKVAFTKDFLIWEIPSNFDIYICVSQDEDDRSISYFEIYEKFDSYLLGIEKFIREYGKTEDILNEKINSSNKILIEINKLKNEEINNFEQLDSLIKDKSVKEEFEHAKNALFILNDMRKLYSDQLRDFWDVIGQISGKIGNFSKYNLKDQERYKFKD